MHNIPCLMRYHAINFGEDYPGYRPADVEMPDDKLGRTAPDNRQSKSVKKGDPPPSACFFLCRILSREPVSGHASAEELSMGHIVKIDVALALP